VIEDLSVNLRNVSLLVVGKSGLNSFLRGVGQVLEDVAGEKEVEGMRCDNRVVVRVSVSGSLSNRGFFL
jgi:hypothetical protein